MRYVFFLLAFFVAMSVNAASRLVIQVCLNIRWVGVMLFRVYHASH